MPERNRPSRKGRRQRLSGDGEQDLFSSQLYQAVKQAFETQAGAPDQPGGSPSSTLERADPSETSGSALPIQGTGADAGAGSERPDEAPSLKAARFGSVDVARGGDSPSLFENSEACQAPQPAPAGILALNPAEPLQARMLNEFVYCPRLFYYEYVEGVFMESGDTLRGQAIHKRVDSGTGAMLPTGAKQAETEGGEPKNDSGASAKSRKKPQEETTEEIHSRSVLLGAERLGLIAKMDLVETLSDESGGALSVRPVDYKAGSPREGPDGNTLWDADKVQLAAQCMVLKENGYSCDGGIIYYRGTKQRVPMPLTPELESWVIAQITAARSTAAGSIPPPLVDSPKCARCSLAPVCLPDETRLLAIDGASGADTLTARSSERQTHTSIEVRRLIAPRDERRPLYLTTQGYRVGCNEGVLKIKENDKVVQEVRVMDVSSVSLFGNIQVSTQAVRLLCEMDIPLTLFSTGGWFYGVTRGHSLTNVLVRIAQFRIAADPRASLRLAQSFVFGKIHNQRVLLMRNHKEPPERTKLRLRQAREDARQTESIPELLGVEGAAAAEYFAEFSGLLRAADDAVDQPPASDANAPDWARFDFTRRNRRPPADPVNALLSLSYSLLAKECAIAAYAVGLDPYVGFYHQPRHGRPALALDVMEEFRPIIAESAVITAINNRFVTPKDFVTAGRAVNLTPAGRKQFFICFERRMEAPVTHPVFDYKVCYRRALELQFRILARVLSGETSEYIPFLTR